MEKNTQCCILCYVDDEKKTYNPGLILQNPETEDEICKVTLELREIGRKVRIFTMCAVDGVNQLPPLDEPAGSGLPGYAYDPWLMW